MTPGEKFYLEVIKNVSQLTADTDLRAAARVMKREMARYNYVYNFRWLGRPIIQMPPDIVGFQELIWEVKPTKIIECGIAHGGSLILSASILAMLDLEARHAGAPSDLERKAIGVDIDIRDHNRKAIEAHFLNDYIVTIEGSSIDPSTVSQVKSHVGADDIVMVFLDSNHVHDHVLQELVNYAPLVSRGSYCIVADAIIEEMPDDFFPDRDWRAGNSPRTAIAAYLDSLATGSRGADGTALRFERDVFMEAKVLFTSAVGGFLRRC